MCLNNEYLYVFVLYFLLSFYLFIFSEIVFCDICEYVDYISKLWSRNYKCSQHLGSVVYFECLHWTWFEFEYCDSCGTFIVNLCVAILSICVLNKTKDMWGLVWNKRERERERMREKQHWYKEIQVV